MPFRTLVWTIWLAYSIGEKEEEWEKREEVAGTPAFLRRVSVHWSLLYDEWKVVSHSPEELESTPTVCLDRSPVRRKPP